MDMIMEVIIASIIGCYLVTSYVIFKFPNLLHRRKDVKFVCRHISHRGGAGENYENTLTAFQSAVDLGTDMLELDCHITRDGQVVVCHDQELLTRTGLSGCLHNYDYCDLPPMKEEIPIDFMPSVTFRGASTDRNIPLLEDVFKQFPNIPINLDIKVDNSELIAKVSDLAKHYKREHLIVWGNVKAAIVEKCYRENPDICLMFSFRKVLILVFLLYSGLLPFVPLRETHLEVFMPSHLYKLFGHRFGNKWWQKALAEMANVLLIRPMLIDHLSKRGIQTYLWVMNTEEDFTRAFQTGATGVMTDYPTLLKKYLDNNQQYAQDGKFG